jgi:protein-S-isoprenylcysteine O-methyltransferase Ste14
MPRRPGAWCRTFSEAGRRRSGAGVDSPAREGRAARKKMQRLLALKSILFVVLVPGTVAGYVPYRMLCATHRLTMPRPGPSSIGAAVLFALGVGAVARCVWDFAAAGLGTPAPFDPPRRLVVRGLYRFMRNPMYDGVLAVVLGEAWLFGSGALLGYAVGIFVVVHLFVVLYEERALAARFGEQYEAYRRAVPRWGFTIHGFRNAG